MKDIILLLTNSRDGAHTHSVLDRLGDSNAFRLDVDSIVNGEVSFILRNGPQTEKASLVSHENEINISQISSIWYRRPNVFDFDIKDSAQRAYAEKEMVAFLHNLFELMPPSVYWMNNPNNLAIARNKIPQLRFARAHGMHVPDTLVTNDPQEVTMFHSFHRKIIFKAIYNEFIDLGSKVLNVPTTLITASHLNHLETIRKLPGMFQQFINKVAEVRITIVEDAIFAVRISPKIPFDMADWRHPFAGHNLKYEIIKLPQVIERFCTDLMRHYGLSFGAIDMMIDEQESYWFLELNPNGQWYWIQDLTGAPIAEAIADNLTYRR